MGRKRDEKHPSSLSDDSNRNKLNHESCFANEEVEDKGRSEESP
jgi:hypothetical protein